MTAKPNFAPSAPAEHRAGDAAAPATGPFVLNLCSSTTPMALAQSELPELKRFTFFVSRRFEEGRERFRLHMGYFATLAEAEEWLNVVREIYPGAWAGEAPGRKLRERAAAAAAAQAQHAVGPQQRASSPPPPVPPAPAPEPHPFAIPENPHPFTALLTPSGGADPIPELIPILHAAASEPPPAPKKLPPAPPAPVAARKPEPVAATPARTAAAQPAPLTPPRPVVTTPPVLPASTPKRSPVAAPPAAPAAVAVAPASAAVAPASAAAAAAAPAAAAPAAAAPAAAAVAVAANKPAAGTQKKAPAAAAFGNSNVREVLQALGDASATGETRLMRSPPPPREAPAPAPKEALSDTQVLKLLEVRRDSDAEPTPAAAAASQGSIPMLKPDDTGTRAALKAAVVSNAPVLFAVQLQWSVQPVELDKVPPLAIFSAYTLYTVEGSRDGRKWYGLRLGFFSDAISAKQVAHYVRSEFAAVAVVPVSTQERARATDQDKQAAILGSAPSAPVGRVDEFKLIDDSTEAAEAVAKIAQQAVPGTPVANASAKKIPGRPVPKPAPRTPAPAPAAKVARPAAKGRGRAPSKVGANESRGAQSLEETLEILGAGQLAIDNGNGETLNASGVRHLRVEVQKNSPFAKLLDRLSERIKKQ
ncbi:MAG: hypothetical protein JSR36_19035 [Proteobacteria bacterium]|nr:hypothetical protein [Pseudomonadota bacterium]